MTGLSSFSLSRFFYLCRQSLGKEQNELFLICFKIVIVFALATVLLGFIGIPTYTVTSSFFYIIFYMSVIRMAANAFPELRNNEKCSFWFMIPGSILEKYLSRLFLTSVGFGLLYSFLFFIGVNIGNIINTLFFDRFYILFVPFKRADALNVIVSFITLHSIFFAGGLFFKKYPLIKTVLFVLLVILSIMICISIIGWFAFSYRISFNIQNFPIVSRYWAVSVSLFYKILFYGVIPIFCWIIGYCRLREVEVC